VVRRLFIMQIPFALLQVIIIPLITAIICLPLGKKLGKNLGWIAAGALAYTTFVLATVGLDLWTSEVPISETYSWSTQVFGINFGFTADGLSLPVALIMNLIVAACAVYSIPYMQHRIEQLYGTERKSMYTLYFSIYLLFSVGLVGVALATNLVAMFLFVELALIPSYIMIDLFGYINRHRVAIMYFLWNQIGAAVFLSGIVLAYVGTGSFDISALGSISGESIGFWVVLLILIGWLVKMATFGFHVWLPYAHGEHPTSIAAIIATIVGLGSYVIARLLYGQLFASFEIFSIPLMILAVVTMVYAAYLTMAQDDVKRLYACSTIGQTAYSLLGIASMTALGVAGGVFYFASHILGKCILFAIAGILLTQTGVRSMKEMGGLAQRMPWTATLCVIGSLILSAIPPLAGFQAEWVMFTGIFQNGVAGQLPYLIIGIVAIFATFLTSVYTFWPVLKIFFGPLGKNMETVKEAPKSMLIPLSILAFTSLIIGMFPDTIMRFITSVI
jgi:formate hydrogenlyase subunit 3/multisubunit Na+/H+ antiporter MnhD subunit